MHPRIAFDARDSPLETIARHRVWIPDKVKADASGDLETGDELGDPGGDPAVLNHLELHLPGGRVAHLKKGTKCTQCSLFLVGHQCIT